MHKLIMLRGNSGSGKTTVAKALQELFGRNTMLLSQDVIRRDILKAKDGIDPPALPLIKQMLEYGSKNCEVVIMEGIFVAEWYRELFEAALELYGSDIYAYYFDIPFEETVRRHQTRSKAAEFGAEDMREWWQEKDYLDPIKETMITEDMSKDEIVGAIYSRVSNG
ncbi:MAG: kinase [Lachnospiraceae bacterium]|nr:kinase [Lachnospiraceae bacterium]